VKTRFGWGLADVGATLLTFFLFLIDPGMNRFFAAKVAAMVHGTALKPYVFRALIPAIARVLVASTPQAWDEKLHAAARGPLAWFFWAAGFEPENATECLVACVLGYASLLAFLFVMRRALATFYDMPQMVGRLAPIAAVLILPAFFGYASFVYDTTTLLFAALGLVLIAEQRWRLYVLVFALAVFNKETAVLLLVPFVASRGRLTRGLFASLLGGQLAIVAVSRIVLRRAFERNGGEYLISQWSRNVEILHHPPIVKLAVCAIIGFAVASGFRTKPALLRHSLTMLVPLVITCALWGYFDELRAYYDAYPTIVLLATPTVAYWFRRCPSTNVAVRGSAALPH
jgi:hypothetical protein